MAKVKQSKIEAFCWEKKNHDNFSCQHILIVRFKRKTLLFYDKGKITEIRVKINIIKVKENEKMK